MNLLQFVDDRITEDRSIAGQRRTFDHVGILDKASASTGESYSRQVDDCEPVSDPVNG